MPSLDLLQNGTRVFVITSCGSISRPEELVSDLGQRTNNHDWVISQASIHDLSEKADRRRILHRSTAKLHDHAYAVVRCCQHAPRSSDFSSRNKKPTCQLLLAVGLCQPLKLVLLSSPDALPQKTRNSCRHTDCNSLRLPGNGLGGQHEVSCSAPGGAAAPGFPHGILRRIAPGDQAAYAGRQSYAAHSRADALRVFCSSCFPIHS